MIVMAGPPSDHWSATEETTGFAEHGVVMLNNNLVTLKGAALLTTN